MGQRFCVVRENLLALRDMMNGSGCTARTVRYYVEQGLLRASRSTGGHRQFPPEELDRLNFIIALREAGWSLEEVTELLHVRDGARADGEACRKLEDLVGVQIQRLERKISVLERLRRDLNATRGLLPVCRECTERERPPNCGDCERVPDPAPNSFRFPWLAGGAESSRQAVPEGETTDGRSFDEREADGSESGSGT